MVVPVKNFGNGDAEAFKLVPVSGTYDNRHKADSGAMAELNKRKLDLKGMFETMSQEIIFKAGMSRHQLIGKIFIDRHAPQRRLPCTGTHDRQRRTIAGVIGAKQNHTVR